MTTSKKISVALLSFFIPLMLFGQNPIDKDLDAKVTEMRAVLFSDPKKVKKIADEIIQISRKKKFLVYEAAAFNAKGIICHFTNSQDSSLIYFNTSEKLGLQANDLLTIGKAKHNKNMPLGILGRYDEAFATCIEALKYYEQLNERSAIARVHGDLGNILIRQKNPAEAVNYLKKALAIAEEIKATDLKPNFLNSLGVAYEYLDQVKNARDIYLQALPLAEKLGNIKNQIGIYVNLGATSWKLDDTSDQSFIYYKKGEALAKEFGDLTKLGDIYQNMGRNYFHNKNIDEALRYALLARDLAIQQKDTYKLHAVYWSLGEYYKLKKDYDKAFENLEKRDSTFEVMFNAKSSQQINELKTKYETEKKQQQIELLNSRNAIQGLEISRNKLELGNQSLALEKNDLLINNQQLEIGQRKAQLIQKELETKAKTQKIELLDAETQIQKLQLLRKNVTIGIIAGILILSAFAGFLFYNRYKLKQETRLQAEVIRQQDLSTKAVLNAEENERKRISGELHDGLGQMFSAVKMNLSGISAALKFEDDYSRQVFDKTLGLVDESCKEVRSISHQMAPNVLLKSGLTSAIRDFIDKIDARKLKVKLETTGLKDRLDQNVETVLYRVIQETVNNVIKHAAANMLDIQLNKDEDGIEVMIEDNGKGFDTSRPDQFEGIGLKNIRSRIEYLKGTVDFSSQPGQGTLVAIHIPL